MVGCEEATDKVGDGVSVLPGAVEGKVRVGGVRIAHERGVGVVLNNMRAGGVGAAEDPGSKAGAEVRVGNLAVNVDVAADCWCGRGACSRGRSGRSGGGSGFRGWCGLCRGGGREEASTPDETVVGATVGCVLGPAGVGGWNPGDVDTGLGLCAE